MGSVRGEGSADRMGSSLTEQEFDLGVLAQRFDGERHTFCLLYTSDAADERSSVDLGGRRIIKKKTTHNNNTQRRESERTVHTVY